jgi:hypothetical protein
LRRLVFICVCAAGACMLSPTAAFAAFKFEGTTNQCPADQGRCGQVAFWVASNLKRVASFSVEFQAACLTATSPITDALTVRNFAAKASRRSMRLSRTQSATLDLGKGFTGDATATLAGKVSAASGNGSGKVSIAIAVKNAAGQQVDTCTTGAAPLRWKAKVV